MAPPDHSLVRLLAGWLPRQRWFGGKDGPIDELTIGTATELRTGDPGLHHLILDVRQNGTTDRYQVLLGVRRDLPGRLESCLIGRLAGGHGIAGHVYDAAHDPELTGPLLAYMANETQIGPLRFRRAPGTGVRTDLESTPIGAEQSNTSLIFGDAYICKLFRRLSPGLNPDLEVNLALSRQGCAHIPAVHGWIELEPGADAAWDGTGDEPVTLALLSEFLRSATDGWQLALTSVRDWFAQPALPMTGPTTGPVPAFTARDAGAVGGDFAAEAGRLGAATAQVHRDLAAAFGVTRAPAAALRESVFAMNEHLDQVSAAVPEIRPHVRAIRAVFDEVAAEARTLPVQRVHGDYHLGQVLRTDSGWVLLDFEGEPARTPAERRAPAHPLRDVAGMLRSFEYAARFLLVRDGDLPPDAAETLEMRARAWAERNREAFCAGYAAAGGPDPAAHAALVRAFEFDKAVYEIRYEARNRPSWLPVPLRSLARLAG
ncbi:aminoglycoside phosphotransferase [Actinomadura sp. 7K507]|uniref:maltokinase N-terminal cap-like domain-containing protein n=1 Tax=Actinomadura sp. 7K507 TaxID=2530365 RepID=UPI001045E6B5|nr:aminoglycoside phosphotransferase [Actinomadura sp. 7K507]TDC77059.1 aminoglycoside phosphotransferase [Actinomadura sp. 7K507]